MAVPAHGQKTQSTHQGQHEGSNGIVDQAVLLSLAVAVAVALAHIMRQMGRGQSKHAKEACRSGEHPLH